MPATVSDIEEGSERPRDTVLQDDNLIFYYGVASVAYRRQALLDNYTGLGKDVWYECQGVSGEMHEIRSIHTVDNMLHPYFKLQFATGASVLIPLQQFLVILGSAHKEWMLVDSTKRLDRVVKRASITDTSKSPVDVSGAPIGEDGWPNLSAVASSTSYDNDPINSTSASLCTPNASIPVVNAFPAGPVAAAPVVTAPAAPVVTAPVVAPAAPVVTAPVAGGAPVTAAAPGAGPRRWVTDSKEADPELRETKESDDLILASSLFITTAGLALTTKGSGPTILGRLSKAIGSATRASGSGIAAALSAATGAFKPYAGTPPPPPRAPREPPPDGPRALQDVIPTVRPEIAYLMKHRPPPEVTEIPAKAATTDGPKVDDDVGGYALWGDRLLIHVRGGKMNVPTGKVLPGEKSYTVAALRIMQEQANLDPVPNGLTEFKKVKTDDHTSIFYYTNYLEKPKVMNPADAFDFSANGVDGEDASGSHFWAPIAQLRLWLADEKHAGFRDATFTDNLRTLTKVLNITTGVDENNLRELPVWSTKTGADGQPLFNPKNVTPLCKQSKVMTADCLPKVVRDDIYTASEFADENRLVKRIDDPYLIEYQRLVKAREEETDIMKKFQIAMQLYYKYPNRSVYIRNPVDNTIHSRVVPNPYKALSYREDGATTFESPNGGSRFDEGGIMKQQNIQLLKELVPSQIVANKAMSIAILESLWYCGQNPTISDDPRCFPARLLGELREYHAERVQRTQEKEAKAVVQTEWPAIKMMLAATRQALAGSQTFSFREGLLTPIIAKKKPTIVPTAPTLAPAAPTLAPAAPTLAPTAATLALTKPALPPPSRERPAPPPPMQTNVRIVPRQLGGGGIRPILPGRALGVLPPLVRPI